MITENFSDDVVSFGEKGSEKHARTSSNIKNQILLLHVRVSQTIITAWSFNLWQLIRQTKSNSEWFSGYRYIILETLVLINSLVQKCSPKATLKCPWGYYDVIMLLLQTLPSSYQYPFQPIIAVLRILYEGVIDKMQPDMSGFQKLE